MNTGQTLLTVGAIVLLGVTVLTVNRTSLQHGVILTQTQIGIYGISLATSIIEEASRNAFDENTVNGVVTSASSMSSTLGPETGEAYPYFDDFDDFNGQTLTYKVAGVDSFVAKTAVCYIDPASPNGKSTTQTFFKRLDVQVMGSAARDRDTTRDYIPRDTVKMSYIYSYYTFR